jgi:hypothetical protein
MNTEPIKHATFSVERIYPAAAARIFSRFRGGLHGPVAGASGQATQ